MKLRAHRHPLSTDHYTEAVAYFLGIDGGGTKTTCLLGDENYELASVTVGGSNLTRVANETARSALERGVRSVCREAAIKPAQISAICAGIAGAAREDVRKQQAEILAQLTPARIEVVGDMVIAHEAALGGAPGIVVLAGTGSIAYGRHSSGRTARAGGWGHAISDEGSGHWIGIQAVAAVAHAQDSRSQTGLSDQILRHWGLRDFDELVLWANSDPTPDFASLFPIVLAAAETGDSCAQGVLTGAGTSLAGLVGAVFRRLWKPNEEAEVSLMGGVLQNSAQVRNSLQKCLRNSVPRVRVSLSTRSGAQGALALARKLTAGGPAALQPR